MKITLRYFDGCPNWKVADERLKQVLAQQPTGGELGYEKVETPADAEQLGFQGSPTVLIDGLDPFSEKDAPVGLSCRVYRTERGIEGAPSVEQLEAALRRSQA